MSQIIGYRSLNDAEIDLINAIKKVEQQAGRVHRRVLATAGINPRWAAIARTELEQGFMALVRAVAQPDSPFDQEHDSAESDAQPAAEGDHSFEGTQ